MKVNYFLLAAFLCISSLLCAQVAEQPRCGMTLEDQMAMWPRSKQNIIASQLAPVHERGMTTYVPVHFHLTKRSNGLGRPSYEQALETLCGMNEYFAPHDIQFYFSPHPSDGELWNEDIESDGVHLNQTNSFLMQLQKHNAALNIYCVNTAQSNTPIDAAAYYTPQFDWVVAARGYLNRTNTLTHEVGHFFSLHHTFWGWDYGSFGPGSAGWPVAPLTPPDEMFNGHQSEKMDGSNCNGANPIYGGDGFCDTPPDYNFGLNTGGCNYNGSAQDPDGVPVVPMENNHMSYFDGCSDFQFTNEQMAAVRADLSNRSFLANTFQPAGTSITTPADMITYPLNNGTADWYNDVTVTWQDVPGATHYLLNLDIIPNFLSPNAKTLIVEGTSANFQDLAADTKYYISLRPFNYAVTCTETQTISFTTGSNLSAAKEIREIQSWDLRPNPVGMQESVQLSVEANQHFEANIQVFDLAGQLVLNMNGQTFSMGQNSIELPTYDLSNGVYFVKLENGGAQATKKLVVVR